jgi:hypothetical protein
VADGRRKGGAGKDVRHGDARTIDAEFHRFGLRVVRLLAIRTYLCESISMRGDEFERRIRKLGRARRVVVTFDAGHGKGSYGRLYFGARFTTLKDRRKEIGPDLLNAMLAQPGLTKQDLED